MRDAPASGRLGGWVTAVASLPLLAACVSGGGDDVAAPATVTVTATAALPEPSVGTVAATTAGGGGSPGAAPAAVSGGNIAATHGELGPTQALPPNRGGTGTAGSGCRPGNTVTLPDGVWMARLVGVTVEEPATATLDLVCFSTVESLAAADVDRAVEDFVVDNDSALTRDVRLAGDVSYYLQQPSPTAVGRTTQRVAFSSEQRAELQAWLRRNGPVLVWVQVSGGSVSEVYSPPLVTV